MMRCAYQVFERVFKVTRKVVPMARIHLQAVQYRWERCGSVSAWVNCKLQQLLGLLIDTVG